MDIDADPDSVPARPFNAWPHSGGGKAIVRSVDLIGIVRHNAGLIFGCALVGAVLAYGVASTRTKSYTAESDLAVSGERVTVPQLQGVLESGGAPDPMPQVHTEVRAIQARQLVIGLVDELHLDRVPEFNAALRPPDLVGEVISAIKSLLPRSSSKPSPDAVRETIVNAVNRNFNITQDNKSLVIGVTFVAEDPRLAASVVNHLIADYVAEIARRRAAADTSANTVLTERIKDVGNEIKRLEQQEKELRASSGMVVLRAGSVGQQQVEDLTIEASHLGVQRSQIEADLARASAAAASGNADELASVLDSPTTSRLREQEAEVLGKVADLSSQFGPDYPDLQSAEANLRAIRGQLGGEAKRIVTSLSTQLMSAEAHEADVKAQLAQAQKAGSASQDVLAQLSQLDLDIASRRALYGSLLQSAQQTMAQPHSDSLPDVRVLSVATTPGLASSPNMKLATGFGGVAGALLAGVMALTRSGEPAYFKDEADVAAVTGAAILGTLRGRGKNWSRLALSSVISGPYAGTLRTVLALMRGMGASASPQVIAMVGAQPGRLTAAVAAALARIAAIDGKSVLLIETSPDQSDAYKSSAETGLITTKLASPDSGWRDRVVQDSTSRVAFLPGHLTHAPPADRAVALENLLVEAREEYDLVLLGGPEIGNPDAIGLARSCDLTLLVVDLKEASPAETRLAAGHLANLIHGRLGAIVLRPA